MTSPTRQIFLLKPFGDRPPPGGQTNDTMESNLSDVNDFTKVCRICATVTNFVVPIYNLDGALNEMARKINLYLPIQVRESDELPLVLCCQCVNTVLAWDDLVQTCTRADTALRARLAAVRAAPAPRLVHGCPRILPLPRRRAEVPSTSTNEAGQNQRDMFYPPDYPVPMRTCGYCSAQVLETNLQQHLFENHVEHLFRCEECNTLPDRKDFYMHMSLHVVENSSARRRRMQAVERPPVPKVEPKVEVKTERGTARETESDVREGTAGPSSAEDGRGAQENEFSDQEAENGFGPLPASVFEAIEETRDGASDEATPAAPAAPPAPPAPPAPAPEEEEPPAPVRRAERVRKCPICSKGYRAASSYFYHMKHSHERSKRHECDACGKKFGTKAGLAEHKTTHSAECRHACEQCGKRFRSKASLYIHAQTHGAPKGWACADCGRAFRWRTQLARHAARHAAARAHTCSTCTRAFSVRADLLRHVRTHAAAAHQCTCCGRTFAQLRYLKVHAANKHGPHTYAKKAKRT